MIVVRDVAEAAGLDQFDIGVQAPADPLAGAAVKAGTLGRFAFADQAAGQHQRQPPLADPLRPGDQQRMRAAPIGQRPAQRPHRRRFRQRPPSIRAKIRIRHRTEDTALSDSG